MLLCEAADATPKGDDVLTGDGEAEGVSVEASEALRKWRWPGAVEGLIRRHGLVPEVTQVPGHAPRTREQWEEWNAVWPIVWQKPNSHLATPLEEPTEVEMAEMRRWMTRAIEAATVCDDAGGSHGGECGGCNAVVIVDPALHSVIATGFDKTCGWRTADGANTGKDANTGRNVRTGHPLRHAVFDAVDAASRRDLLKHPQEGQTSPEVPPQALQQEQGEPGVGEKRRREAIKGVGATLTELTGRPYLCTGYDAYCVREPCVMCAMALVHSRVRRVIYGVPSRRTGALGGGLYSLHGQRTLNHHYVVYSFGLEEEHLAQAVREAGKGDA